MNRSGENSLMLFSRLAYGLVGKQSLATVGRSPALVKSVPQTSLSMSSWVDFSQSRVDMSTPFSVFELPDGLILSILSHISPDLWFAGQHAQFRVQYCMEISNHRKLRARFLLLLSMTCKMMRLRFLLWIWNISSHQGGTTWRTSKPSHMLRTRIYSWLPV